VQGLTQLILALLELLEAEGRALRYGAIRLATVIVVMIVAGLLALGGVAFLVWAMFLGFRFGAEIHVAWAAFFTGLITLLVSGAIVWSARLAGK